MHHAGVMDVSKGLGQMTKAKHSSHWIGDTEQKQNSTMPLENHRIGATYRCKNQKDVFERYKKKT